MKTQIAICCFALAWGAALVASGQAIGAVDALYPDSDPAEKPQGRASRNESPPAERNDEEILKRLDLLDAHLGSSSRPPSITHNVERRLSNLERRVQQMEQQQSRMQQFDQRIRRLEMK
ncbi:MAG: hypothetical protein EOM72_01220 [Opitutae bacterium]|nr:hypothetical protein [Opitutae bacterium]